MTVSLTRRKKSVTCFAQQLSYRNLYKLLICNKLCVLLHDKAAAFVSYVISLTECNTGTTPKLPFAVKYKNWAKKNITIVSENTGTLLSKNTLRQMPLLSDVAAILVSSIVLLTPNGQFLDCATVAFSERY